MVVYKDQYKPIFGFDKQINQDCFAVICDLFKVHRFTKNMSIDILRSLHHHACLCPFDTAYSRES